MTAIFLRFINILQRYANVTLSVIRVNERNTNSF